MDKSIPYDTQTNVFEKTVAKVKDRAAAPDRERNAAAREQRLESPAVRADKPGKAKPPKTGRPYAANHPSGSGADSREPLRHGVQLQLVSEKNRMEEMTVGSVIGRGGSCMVYRGEMTDILAGKTVSRSVVIKEYYPAGLAIRRDGTALRVADEAQQAFALRKEQFLHGQIHLNRYYEDSQSHAAARPFFIGAANGTIYAVSDPNETTMLSEIDRNALSLHRVAMIVTSLTKSLQRFHENGYLYLDCKPENIFFSRYDAQDADIVRLFDFDTVTSIDMLQSRSYICKSCSKGWAPPEQVAWYDADDISGIGRQTDLYAIGAVFFWLLTGRAPDAEQDWKRLQNSDFNWVGYPLTKDCDAQTIACIQEIASHTLSPDPFARYETDASLLLALQRLASLTATNLTLHQENLMLQHKITAGTDALLQENRKMRSDMVQESGKIVDAIRENTSKLDGIASSVSLQRYVASLEFAEQHPERAAVAYQQGAAAGVAVDQYQLGLCYEHGRGGKAVDWRKAAELYQSAADAYPLAAFRLARLYMRGIDGDPDYGRAVALLRQAIEAKCGQAYNALGLCYENGWGVEQDIVKARHLYQEGVMADDELAKSNLGRYYTLGWGGLQVDFDKAVELYEASYQVSPGSAFNLGHLYEWGKSSRGTDNGKAFGYYKIAAESAEVPQSYQALGRCYEQGKGTAKDLEKSFYWYQKGADAEVPQSVYSIGRFFENGWVVKRDVHAAIRHYERAAALGCSGADLALGNIYYYGRRDEAGAVIIPVDYENAFPHYLRAAKSGNAPDAYNPVGYSYEKGLGTEKDLQQAFYWYQKGADANVPVSVYNVGTYYENGRVVKRDLPTAIRYYEKAVALGYARADLALGKIYYYGRRDDAGAVIIPVDYEKAFPYYLRAAESGEVPDVYNRLGVCFGLGEGTAKDQQKALYWYKKGADANVGVAASNAGRSYENGWAAKRDLPTAIRYYEKAAALGYAGADLSLGNIYYYGRRDDAGAVIIPVDYEKAFPHYLRAAESGEVPDAYCRVGYCYECAKGTVKDYGQAAYWYRKGAEAGDAAAQSNLAALYEAGCGVDVNCAEAVKWYEKAAEQGQVRAQFRLAELYRKGASDVAPNPEKAFRWYYKAAKQQYIPAYPELASCYERGAGVRKELFVALRWYHYHQLLQPDSSVGEEGVRRIRRTLDTSDIYRYETGSAQRVKDELSYAECLAAVCYENGSGVAQNLQQASRLMGSALQRGYPKVMLTLKENASRQALQQRLEILLDSQPFRLQQACQDKLEQWERGLHSGSEHIEKALADIFASGTREENVVMVLLIYWNLLQLDEKTWADYGYSADKIANGVEAALRQIFAEE